MEEAWGRTGGEADRGERWEGLCRGRLGGGGGVTGGRTEGEDRVGRMWRTRGRTGEGPVGGSRWSSQCKDLTADSPSREKWKHWSQNKGDMS